MGFFDRFRTPRTTRYELRDEPLVQRPVNENLYGDRPITDGRVIEKRRDDSGWLWLLLIPLFLLLGLGAYTYLGRPNVQGITSGQPSFLSKLFNGTNSNQPSNTNNGLQFGVGGSPVTPTPTPSKMMQLTATPMPTSQSGSVQSASDRLIPSVAPSTGRGVNR
jgi:hypothetical protein